MMQDGTVAWETVQSLRLHLQVLYCVYCVALRLLWVLLSLVLHSVPLSYHLLSNCCLRNLYIQREETFNDV